MIYIIYGDEPYLIDKKINEIISKNTDSFISKYNGLDKDYSNTSIVESCTSMGLFAQKTLVLVNNPPFLIKKMDDKSIDDILEYCNKPLYENDLVLYTLDNAFNTRLKTFKDVCLNAEVIEFNKLQKYEYYSYAKNLIKEKNININNDALDLLIKCSNYDISLLNNNLNVLSLYPEIITIDVVSKMITMPNEDDVFELINALTSKKVSLAIKRINSITSNEDSILGLISLIATQLRFLYSVSYYYSIGKTTNEIMKLTNSKEYRIIKANESLKNLTSTEILKLLSKLSDLDYKCKLSNDLSEKMSLELLVVSLLA